MSRKCLLDCSANGAKWADDVHLSLPRLIAREVKEGLTVDEVQVE